MGLDYCRETTWVLLGLDKGAVGSICSVSEAWNREINSTKEHQPSSSFAPFSFLRGKLNTSSSKNVKAVAIK